MILYTCRVCPFTLFFNSGKIRITLPTGCSSSFFFFFSLSFVIIGSKIKMNGAVIPISRVSSRHHKRDARPDQMRWIAIQNRPIGICDILQIDRGLCPEDRPDSISQ